MSFYLSQLVLLGFFLVGVRVYWWKWQNAFTRFYGAQASQQRHARAYAIRLNMVANIALATVMPGSIVLSFVLSDALENTLSVFFICFGIFLLASFGVPAILAKRKGADVYKQYAEELGRISLTGFRSPIQKIAIVSVGCILLGTLALV